MSWLLLNTGDYVNLDAINTLTATQVGSIWLIKAPGTLTLPGTFATQAAAQDAIRKLVKGVDSTTLV